MAPSDTRKAIAAAVLATGATYQQAADEANVSLSTIKRWSAEDDFAADVATATDTHITTFRDRLKREVVESIEKLVELRDHSTSDQVQLRAAIDILDRAKVRITAEDTPEDVVIRLNMNDHT